MKFIAGCIGFFTLAASAVAGDRVVTQEVKKEPTKFTKGSFEASYDSAMLFGLSNPNHYIIAPQMISGLWQPFERSDKWWLPDAFSVGAFGIAIPIVHGPETFYGGGGLMARLRWLPTDYPISFVADWRMGMGAIDSVDKRDTQGQDFTFVLQASGAIEWQATERMSVRLGVMWNHLSNAELSEPEHRNVGLDAIGPQLGFGYQF